MVPHSNGKKNDLLWNVFILLRLNDKTLNNPCSPRSDLGHFCIIPTNKQVHKSVCVTYLSKLCTIVKVQVLWVKCCKVFQHSIKTYATINTDVRHTQRFNFIPPIWHFHKNMFIPPIWHFHKNMFLLQWRVCIKSKSCISIKKWTENPIGHGSDVYLILWKQILKTT